MKTLRYLLPLLILVTGSTPATSGADDLVIVDTNGFTRAAQQVSGSGRIQFEVSAAGGGSVEGATVLLTNATSGETLMTTVINGVAVFEGVSPGVWTVSSAAPGLTFTSISIGGTAGLAAGVGPGLGPVAAGVLATGAVGIAVAEALDDDGSGSTELSPAS